MVEPVILESFVTAVACLCASSYGPNTRPTTNIRDNIASAISGWDRSVLQIFVNSNRKFSFHDNSGDCELPDSHALDERLYDLEYETKKQELQRDKLDKELRILRSTCLEPGKNIVLVTADENQIKELNSTVNTLRKSLENFQADVLRKDAENKDLKLQHEKDQIELEKLRKEITKLKTKSKNGCLLTKKHGVSKIDVCLKQNVFCAKDLDAKYGNGWMLVSQRFNGSEHFYYNWINYIEGFGKHGANFEFLIGLERIHTLTRSAQYELLIILTDINGQTRFAQYDNFAIAEATKDYALKSLGKYSGDAGDSLSYHLGQKFSTFDKNNLSKCAANHTGAWWYREEDCLRSNLFGLYRSKRPKNDPHKLNGMIWSTFHNTDDGSLLSMRMYLRPKEDLQNETSNYYKYT